MTNLPDIRAADVRDAAAINRLYNPFILETPVTFETDPVDDSARAAWIEALRADAKTPVVVAEREGEIVGLANASRFDPRPGYDVSVKVSVFVAPDHQGQGIARNLYARLFTDLRKAKLHRAYALIVEPNPASVRLHEFFGFEQVGRLDEVGFKFGEYHSVLWFEKAVMS
ncbi:MAG: N-acetyltransferase family protein [Pseudomonadota bacterium]